MEEVVAKLLLFPPYPAPQTPLTDQQYEAGIKAQIDTLKTMSEKNLTQTTPGGESSLDVIDPTIHSNSYLYLLLSNVSAAQKGNKKIDIQHVWKQIESFFASFDAKQIRYTGGEIRTLIECAASIARENKQPGIAVIPIQKGLLRLDPTSSVLTTSHVTLVKLAVESQEYACAFPVVEKPILFIPQAAGYKAKNICEDGLSPTMYITATSGFSGRIKGRGVLEYLYYGSTVCIGLKKWDEAQRLLEMAIIFPTLDQSASKIMVEAYKKWVLVSLLNHGKAVSLPHMEGGPARLYHTLGKPYETIASIFETGTAARLRSEVDMGSHIWIADGNFGLTQQILSGFQKCQIRRLSNIYVEISIPEIVSQTMSAETGNRLTASAVETLIKEMIEDESLNGSLTHASNASAKLQFLEPDLSEEQMEKELKLTFERIQRLNTAFKMTDHFMSQNKTYVEHAQKLAKAKNNPAVEHIDPDFDNSVEDEDIMTGLA